MGSSKFYVDRMLWLLFYWGGNHDFFPDMFSWGLPKISINMTEGKRLGKGEKK